MNQSEIEHHIEIWIDHARTAKMLDRIDEFWLMLDFVSGKFGGGYYRKNREKFLRAIERIDKTKGKNSVVCGELRKIGEVIEND